MDARCAAHGAWQFMAFMAFMIHFDAWSHGHMVTPRLGDEEVRRPDEMMTRQHQAENPTRERHFSIILCNYP
jgi:hypothetical protein